MTTTSLSRALAAWGIVNVFAAFTAAPAAAQAQPDCVSGCTGTYSVNVTPDGQGLTATPGTQVTVTFDVFNTGTASDTYTLTCSATGSVTCVSVSPSSLTLAADLDDQVTVTFTAGAAGTTGVITLTATGSHGPVDPGSYNVSNSIPFAPSTVTSGAFTKDSRYLLLETANVYDGYGRITQLTDARSKVTNYEYLGGPNNNTFLSKVTQVHDASGTVHLVTDITYDANGFVSSIKDPGGSSRYFTYDGYGRLRQVKNNASTIVKAYGYTYSRTSANNWTYSSSSPNAIVDTTFLRQTPTPAISVVSTQFIDGLGRTIQSVVQDGTNLYYVAATQYDLMGRPWRAWKPYSRTDAGYDGSFTTAATTSYNNYLGVSNAKPFTETQYRADPLGRVSKFIPEYTGTSPASALTAYGIDATAKQAITELTDESGNRTRTYSDFFGNTVKSILGSGSTDATTTTFIYNVLGQRTQTTDPRGLITTYTLDTRGLLSTRFSPDAGTANFKYDKAGNLRYTQDANQAGAGVVYFTNYDFAARPLNSGQGTATFSTLDPDAASPPALETTNGNWLVVRAYDAPPSTANLPWSFFSTQITSISPTNVVGRLAAVASKSNGAWQVTLFSYDEDGQVSKRYTYTQANGGASVLTALNTNITYARDLRGALTQRSDTIGSSTFFYQWYDYNTRGLLWKLYANTTSTKPATADVTDTYRPSGVPQNYQFLGGPLVPIAYTIREQTAKVGDPTITTNNPYPFSASYTYNPNGTISVAEFYSAGSPAAQKRYKYAFTNYDALNRLKSADFSWWSGAWTTTNAYDIGGIIYDTDGNLKNLQRNRQDGTLIDNLTYNYLSTSNRLSSISDAIIGSAETWDAEAGAFTYDANGNVKTAPAPYSITSAITYDPANLPLSITRSGTTTNYRYDDAGQRITKQDVTTPGNTQVYIREGPTTLGVFTVNSSGAVVSSYFNLVWQDRVVGRQPITPTGNRDYYHFDILGSARAVTQGVTVVESHDYDPWGLEMPARGLGSGTKEAFNGKEQDSETGLDYFGARYYMPALGRWTAVDRLADKFPSWSAYGYALNNPALLLDPDGLAVLEPNRRQAATARMVIEVIRHFFGNGPTSLQSLRYTQGATGGGEQVGPFGGGEGARYVYTTKRGWLDLAHFFQVAAEAQTELGGGLRKFAAKTVLRSVAVDKLWNATQQVENAQHGETRWSYEDGPSNKAGLDFFLDFYTDDKNLIQAITSFLADAGAVDPREAPNWPSMQPAPEKRRRFKENRSLTPVIDPEPDTSAWYTPNCYKNDNEVMVCR
jgi:RHS repeat-associated protein